MTTPNVEESLAEQQHDWVLQCQATDSLAQILIVGCFVMFVVDRRVDVTLKAEEIYGIPNGNRTGASIHNYTSIRQ